MMVINFKYLLLYCGTLPSSSWHTINATYIGVAHTVVTFQMPYSDLLRGHFTFFFYKCILVKAYHVPLPMLTKLCTFQ